MYQKWDFCLWPFNTKTECSVLFLFQVSYVFWPCRHHQGSEKNNTFPGGFIALRILTQDPKGKSRSQPKKGEMAEGSANFAENCPDFRAALSSGLGAGDDYPLWKEPIQAALQTGVIPWQLLVRDRLGVMPRFHGMILAAPEMHDVWFLCRSNLWFIRV